MTGASASTGWRVLLAATAVAVGWLACSPHPPEAIDTGWDKLNHLCAFAALAFCAERGFGVRAWRRSSAALLAYGGAIELVQSQIPGRSAEAADLLADAAGIAIGWALAALWRRLQR